MMKTYLLSAICACVMGALWSTAAQADIIIDPDGLGLTAVYPPNLQASPDNLDYLYVGYSGFDGSLEVNADYAVNAETTIGVTNTIQIGASLSTGGGAGTLRVIGDGGYDSAVVTGEAYFSVGIGGDGLVEIRDGARVSAKNIQLGSSSTIDADIIVDGVDARLQSTGGGISFSGEAIGATRSLTVSNSATVEARGIYDGAFTLGAEYSPGNMQLNQGDHMTLTSDSLVLFETNIFSRGTIEVRDYAVLAQDEPYGVIDSITSLPDPRGYMSMSLGALDTTARLQVDTDGYVYLTRNMRIGGFNDLVEVVPDGQGGYLWIEEGTSAETIIETGGELFVDGDIIVSENGTTGGDGTLTVRDGGSVYATNIIVNEGGLLNGAGGMIYSDVTLEGGTIAPGNSPGELSIFGDLLVIDGVIDLEFAGADFGEYDVLNVFGSTTLSPDTVINLNFINGFAPLAYETFTLLDGDVSGLDQLVVNVLGLEAGFDYALSSTGGLSLVALNDGIAATSPVPVPTAAWLFCSGLIGLLGVARRKKS